MRVLVTGGAGFIGANLVRRLESRPEFESVVVLDDLSTGSQENLNGTGAELIEGSILDPQALKRAIHDVDAIVHLAARPSVPRSITDPEASHEANATGTIRVLEAARASGDAYVVVASSSSVYGANPTLPKTEDLTPRPMSPYAVSKLATEQYALAYRECYSLPTLAFRFFNVYGPLQSAGHAYAAVIPVFVDAALRYRPLPVHGDGEQTRDFTYVGTVVDVLAHAVVHHVTASTPVNLAFGTRHSLLDLIDLLERILGRSLEVEHQAARVGDVRHSQADQSLVRALFTDVEPVGLDAGLEATVAWFRSIV